MPPLALRVVLSVRCHGCTERLELAEPIEPLGGRRHPPSIRAMAAVERSAIACTACGGSAVIDDVTVDTGAIVLALHADGRVCLDGEPLDDDALRALAEPPWSGRAAA